MRVRQVRLLDPLQQRDQIVDLWIDQGRIRAIETPLDPNCRRDPDELPEWSGQGWIVGPGLVDLYSHSGEPGFEQRETLASLAQAALAGGFTQVGVLPTVDPVVDGVEVLSVWQQRPLPLSPAWIPLAAVTLGTKGEQLAPLAELAAGGAAGFCEDSPLGSPALLRRVLDYLQPLGKPLLIWPRTPSLVQGGVMQEGSWALRLGLKGIPSTAETTAVASLLEMMRDFSTPVHLMRLSQRRSLELIQSARQDGIPVTTSTTWMHLLHCDADIARHRYSPHLRLDPPLGTLTDQEQLISGIQTGAIESIATDHAPYTYEEKMVPFGDAPPGCIGLELALPLLWSHLVKTARIPPLRLWEALSVAPARTLGLDPPQIAVGDPANLVFFNPERTWTATPATLHSRSLATVWLNQPILGKVEAVIWDGHLVGCGIEGPISIKGTD